MKQTAVRALQNLECFNYIIVSDRKYLIIPTLSNTAASGVYTYTLLECTSGGGEGGGVRQVGGGLRS